MGRHGGPHRCHSIELAGLLSGGSFVVSRGRSHVVVGLDNVEGVEPHHNQFGPGICECFRIDNQTFLLIWK